MRVVVEGMEVEEEVVVAEEMVDWEVMVVALTQ